MMISFARHQFLPAIIRHAVWLYVRFTLSYRDVAPDVLVTDKLRSYRAARSEIGLSACHEQGLSSRVDDWRSGCRSRGVAVRRQLSHIAGASIRTVAPFPVVARQ
jgi:transposase-like protein